MGIPFLLESIPACQAAATSNDTVGPLLKKPAQFFEPGLLCKFPLSATVRLKHAHFLIYTILLDLPDKTLKISVYKTRYLKPKTAAALFFLEKNLDTTQYSGDITS